MFTEMVIRKEDEMPKLSTQSFASPVGDFVALFIENGGDRITLHIPNEHLIAFHAAMVDALASHVDEQRAAQLTAADEELVDLIASGAKLTIRGDAETEVA